MTTVKTLISNLVVDPCDNDKCDRLVVGQTEWRELSKGDRNLLKDAGYAGHGARGLCSPCYRKVYKKMYDPNDILVLDAHSIAAEHEAFPPRQVKYTPTRRYEPETWTADAACNSTDTEAFFPTGRTNVSVVKKVCAHCPVRVDCLLSAISHREEYGIWGGLTENELEHFYAELDEKRPTTTEIVVPTEQRFSSVVLADLTSEFDNDSEPRFVDEEGVPFV